MPMLPSLEQMRRHSREKGGRGTYLESPLVSRRDNGREPLRFELKLPASEWLEVNSTASIAASPELVPVIKAMVGAGAIEIDTVRRAI